MRRLILLVLLLAFPLAARRFQPDDPLIQEPRPRRVETAMSRKLSNYYDFFHHTFARPGERQAPGRLIPAGGVNTLGEALNSAWYQNRHGRTPMSIEELVRGPDNDNPPSMAGSWSVISVKSEGITPGLVIRDSRGEQYWLKFDPVSNPEMATAADVIGSRFFHALGYNVPEYYLVTFTRDRLQLTETSVVKDKLGQKRRMSSRDLAEVLLKVPHDSDGRYRAVASLRMNGVDLGPFRYSGTRSDDLNDTVPHERRRDLRGLFVFCAWLGHDDSRAINTIDFLVDEGDLRYIKHYLIDFGSILGSASTKANSARSGNEHLFAWKPAALQFFTLGLYVPHWARAHFPHLPSVGRFESRIFDPERYKTEYPNPAFLNRLPDDTFWAARQVMVFTDDQIRAIVRAGQYSDRRAEEWIVKCLIERRDKIGRTYLERVLPLDRFEIDDSRLRFEDLGVRYGFASRRDFSIQWSEFDNESGRKTPLAGATGAEVPAALRSAVRGAYFAADIHAGSPARGVTVYVRKDDRRYVIVGIDRTWQ